MTLRLIPLMLAAAIMLGAAESPRRDLLQVTAVRHWVLDKTTRVVIEVSGEFKFHHERLHNPERVFFDIRQARPWIDGRRVFSREIKNRLVDRIRVAETLPGVTRIVLDLANPVEFTVRQMANPSRLVVELSAAPPARGTVPGGGTQPDAATPEVKTAEKSGSPAGTSGAGTAASARAAGPGPDAKPTSGAENAGAAKPGSSPDAKPAVRPTAGAGASEETAKSSAGKTVAGAGKPGPAPDTKSPTRPAPTAGSTAEKTLVASARSGTKAGAVPARPHEESRPEGKAPTAEESSAAGARSDRAAAAKRNSAGKNSLIRALGLKVMRVVLDPGHGGHDQGTVGPKGLMEKELVLDVARRLGKIIEDNMGAEVIFTRTDDTFVPLERRTALANEKRADLFLSIHANSSPYSRTLGVETFYLNFTNAKDALDVAARENASSEKTIHELQDIVLKITKHEKSEESREFAGRVQAALYSFSARAIPGARNRGVRKAPFVVLIGAQMPSILCEIGFLSNPREEALLKRPDHRQKLAEALYRGVSRYAESLSHFQIAKK